MKYIIIPILKLIFAICVFCVQGIVFFIFHIINLLWDFSSNINDTKDLLIVDMNSDWEKALGNYNTKFKYKTIWHWMFNGNFKNFK